MFGVHRSTTELIHRATITEATVTATIALFTERTQVVASTTDTATTTTVVDGNSDTIVKVLRIGLPQGGPFAVLLRRKLDLNQPY